MDICDAARVFMIVILPKRVSLLADQSSKILLIFSIFSIKLELRKWFEPRSDIP